MAQTKHDIKSLLAEHGLSPRHRYGQNFMIDQNLVRLVADAGQIQPTDLVIEVGPGTGTLTEELLHRGAQVVAVEIDHDLAALLRSRLGSEPSLQIIEADALKSKHRLNSDIEAILQNCLAQNRSPKLVANLPYNIASPLIIELLLAGVQLLAFTVQKEVAYRLRAKPREEQYGALSVMAQLLADVQLLRNLPPQAFWPAPAIESSLVRMVRADRLGDKARQFGQFVHALFSSRRKMLRNSLDVPDAQKVADKAGIQLTDRPEDLDPQSFLRLFSELPAAQ